MTTFQRVITTTSTTAASTYYLRYQSLCSLGAHRTWIRPMSLSFTSQQQQQMLQHDENVENRNQTKKWPSSYDYKKSSSNVLPNYNYLHSNTKQMYFGKRQCYHFHTTTNAKAKSNGDDNDNGHNHHKLFEQQLLELNEERDFLFGQGANPTNGITTSTNDTSNDDVPSDLMNKLGTETCDKMENIIVTEEEVMEREAVYNFTSQEKAAWTANTYNANDTNNSSSIVDQKHSPELMQAIQAARKEMANRQEQLEQELLQEQLDVQKKIQRQHKKEEDATNNATDASGNSAVFTHLNTSGNEISMVDVGTKESTRRVAVARSVVVFPPEVMEAFDLYSVNDEDGGEGQKEMVGPKGPIFATARLAGIMGAKRTSDLIPLCHPLPLEKVNVDIQLVKNTAVIKCECRVSHKTGVEMEALSGASIAALTIYDMVKAVSHRVRIEGTELIQKRGGKRDVSNNS